MNVKRNIEKNPVWLEEFKPNIILKILVNLREQKSKVEKTPVTY